MWIEILLAAVIFFIMLFFLLLIILLLEDRRLKDFIKKYYWNQLTHKSHPTSKASPGVTGLALLLDKIDSDG